MFISHSISTQVVGKMMIMMREEDVDVPRVCESRRIISAYFHFLIFSFLFSCIPPSSSFFLLFSPLFSCSSFISVPSTCLSIHLYTENFLLIFHLTEERTCSLSYVLLLLSSRSPQSQYKRGDGKEVILPTYRHTHC